MKQARTSAGETHFLPPMAAQGSAARASTVFAFAYDTAARTEEKSVRKRLATMLATGAGSTVSRDWCFEGPGARMRNTWGHQRSYRCYLRWEYTVMQWTPTPEL